MDFYTDDVLFTDPTFGIVAKGKGDFRKLHASLGTDQTAYRGIRWNIKNIIFQNDSVVIRGEWSGRFQDCDFEIDFITLWHMRDGKIAGQDDYFAASSFDRQVGWNGTTANCK